MMQNIQLMHNIRQAESIIHESLTHTGGLNESQLGLSESNLLRLDGSQDSQIGRSHKILQEMDKKSMSEKVRILQEMDKKSKNEES
jgi:hypothetical protein